MMHMFYHKQQKNNTSKMVAAGVVGAVVGAVGTAATIALSDENTRYKVSNTLSEWKDKSMAKIQEFRKLDDGRKASNRSTKATKV